MSGNKKISLNGKREKTLKAKGNIHPFGGSAGVRYKPKTKRKIQPYFSGSVNINKKGKPEGFGVSIGLKF